MQSNSKGDVELSVTLDTSSLKKETEKIKTEIEKGVATSNTEIKPQTDVKPIQIVVQQAKQASAALQQTVKNASNVANEIGDVDKKIPTEEFAQLSQNAAWLERELEKANSQLDHMDLINEDNTKRFSNLADKANELEIALKRTKDQMQAMIDSGEAFEKVTAPQDDTTQREAELARLQAILDRNRESANELATEMENVAVASNDAANSFAYENPLEKTDLPEQFKDKVEETQQEIVNTQEQAVNQFENEYARFIEYIQASEQKAREMANVIAGLKDVGVDPDQLAQMEKEYDTLINKIALMRQSIKIGSTAWNEMEPKERLVLFIDRLKIGLNEVGQELTTKVNDGLNELSKNLGNVAKNAAKSSLQGLSKWFRKLVPDLNRTNRGFNLGIKNILGYAIGIRSLFSLFTKLRSAITEGIHNLAQWRDGNNEVNENLSVFISSLLQLKNQIGAAFAPILNIVVPILNTFIASMTEAMNVLAQFIAKITGQQTWIRATKVQKNYADSLKGTAKAAKDASGALAPFDDLQILNKKNAGAGSIDPNDMFEEVSLTEMDEKVNDWINKLKLSWEMADFTDFGKDIGTWLRNALNSINWTGIKDTARKIAKSIATLINGFVETEGLGDSIGKTIAEAINTAFEFVYSFVTNLHWDSIGKFIGEGLLGFVNNIDGKLIGDSIGQTLWGAIQLAFHTVKTFADGDGFKTLGQQVSAIISGVFEKMSQTDAETGKNGWQMLGESLSTTAIGLLDTLLIVLNNLPWEEIGQAIADLISSIDWSTIGWDLLECAKSALNGIKKAISSMTGADDTIVGIGMAIAGAIALSGKGGFNLSSIGISVPKAVLTVLALDVIAKNTEMVTDRMKSQDISAAEDIITKHTSMNELQNAAAQGVIISDEEIKKVRAEYQKYIDDLKNSPWPGVRKQAQEYEQLMWVLDERLGDVRDQMAKNHPELKKTLDEFPNLNNSYERAVNVLTEYNKIIGEQTEDYRFLRTEEEQRQQVVNNSIREFDEYGNMIVDLGNSASDAGAMLENTKQDVIDLGNAASGAGVKFEDMEVGNEIMGDLATSTNNTTSKVVELTPAIVEVKDNVEELHPVMEDAITDFEVLDSTVEESGGQISDGFLGGLQRLKQGWEDFWNDLIFWFKEAWIIGSPSKLMEGFGVYIVEGLIIGIESMVDKIKGIWDSIKSTVLGIVESLISTITTKISTFKLSFLGAFVEIQSKFISIWNKIKDGVKSPINAIIGLVEGMVNKIIDGINGLTAKLSTVANVKFKNPFNGETTTLGFPSIGQLQHVSIPRLAQGAVIPPNKEFMAMLGDQTSGTNIEAPLDTITEAFADVVGSMRNTGNAVMQLDGQTFARLVVPYVMGELDRRGYNVKVLEG